MRGHALHDISSREQAFEELRKEILGGRAAGPFEFAADLNFNTFKPTATDPEVVKRLKHAVRRDARFGTANAFYVRLYGMGQGLRGIYDGGRQLIDGGAE